MGLDGIELIRGEHFAEFGECFFVGRCAVDKVAEFFTGLACLVVLLAVSLICGLDCALVFLLVGFALFDALAHCCNFFFVFLEECLHCLAMFLADGSDFGLLIISDVERLGGAFAAELADGELVVAEGDGMTGSVFAFGISFVGSIRLSRPICHGIARAILLCGRGLGDLWSSEDIFVSFLFFLGARSSES